MSYREDDSRIRGSVWNGRCCPDREGGRSEDRGCCSNQGWGNDRWRERDFSEERNRPNGGCPNSVTEAACRCRNQGQTQGQSQGRCRCCCCCCRCRCNS
ncbi:MAG: hypothetical protein GX299_09635 [Epulopiscium sp.]|nr:hypothetical protein [Candidatus Epulonipiscium sp.]